MQKPPCQPIGGIHVYEDQSCFSLGGFIQFGRDQIQLKATFCIPLSALNRIAVTGLFANLPLLFSVSFSGFRTNQSRA